MKGQNVYNIKGLLFGLLTVISGVLTLIIPMYVALIKEHYKIIEEPVSIFSAIFGNSHIYPVTKAICVIILVLVIVGIILSLVGSFMAYKGKQNAKNLSWPGAIIIMFAAFAGTIIGFVSNSTYEYGAIAYGEIAFGLTLCTGIPFMVFSK